MTAHESKTAKMPYKSISKFDLAATPQYGTCSENASSGGRQYGHYAELDPAFEAVKPHLDAAVKKLWDAPDRSWATLRKALGRTSEYQQQQPASTTGRDTRGSVVATHGKVRVRDGAEIKIEVLRSTADSDKQATTAPKEPSLLVMRIHGGGWCLDPAAPGQDDEDWRIAAMPNVVVLRVSYRLAPEYVYPHALNDVYDVLLWCKINADDLGIDPERILLIGSDAGASLAASVALKARDKGVTGIVGQVLDFPMTCHPKFHFKARSELKSYEQNVEATTMSAPLVDLYYDAYVPDAEEDSYHSPLVADSLAFTPPALVQVAGFDPLRDEGIAFSERLIQQGIPSELHVYKGLPHGFPDILPALEQTSEFKARQDDFIRRCANRQGIFAPTSR